MYFDAIVNGSKSSLIIPGLLNITFIRRIVNTWVNSSWCFRSYLVHHSYWAFSLLVREVLIVVIMLLLNSILPRFRVTTLLVLSIQYFPECNFGMRILYRLQSSHLTHLLRKGMLPFQALHPFFFPLNKDLLGGLLNWERVSVTILRLKILSRGVKIR
jgi:hypothetical protein